MLSPNSFLEKCHRLSSAGYRPPFVPGMRVARGFADLGFEEYFILSGSRVVSLFTGEVGPLSNEDKEHFFHVPSADEVLEELVGLGFTVTDAKHEGGREWRVTATSADDKSQSIECAGYCLNDVFVDVLEKVLGHR